MNKELENITKHTAIDIGLSMAYFLIGIIVTTIIIFQISKITDGLVISDKSTIDQITTMTLISFCIIYPSFITASEGVIFFRKIWNRNHKSIN